MSKIFIDTNILIYAMDQADRIKQEKCRSLLRRLQKEDIGVVSTQILQEFYVVSIKKLHLEPLLAKSIIHSFESFEVVVIDPPLIETAVDCSILNKISFWDSLVLVSAERACCGTIWSEDLNHGQIVRGVKIENPLMA